MKYIWFILSIGLFLTTCKKADKNHQTSTSDIQVSTVNNGSSVTFVGHTLNVAVSELKQVGFIWGRSANPTINDASSFSYNTTPSEDFQYRVSAGFKKDSIYYVTAYFLDNSNIYHYGKAVSFTTSGTKSAVITIGSQYTWDDEAEISVDTLAETNINNINITLNDAITIHPDKIVGKKLNFKVPEGLTNRNNSLYISIFGQKSNTAQLFLFFPQLTAGDHNLLNGGTLTLNGKYFNPQTTLNKVLVGTTPLQVTNSTISQLNVQGSNITMSVSGQLTIQTGTNLSITTSDNYNVYKYLKPKTPFPGAPRGNPIVLTINNKIYCGLGGLGLSDWWQYDPNTDTWTRLADSPRAMSGVSSFVIGNIAYIGNGNIGGYLSSGFYAFDTQTNTWSIKPAIPIPTANILSAPLVLSSDKYGYLVSGFLHSTNSTNPTNVPVNDVWKYDPATGQWQKIANFPGIPRQLGMSFNLSGKGYVAGGFTTGLQSSTKDCWAFDFTTESWTQVASTPQDAGSINGFAFALNGKGYIGGGELDTSTALPCPYIYEYDPVANVWIKKEKMLDSSLIDGAGAAGLNGKGYIVGGSPHAPNGFQEFTP